MVLDALPHHEQIRRGPYAATAGKRKRGERIGAARIRQQLRHEASEVDPAIHQDRCHHVERYAEASFAHGSINAFQPDASALRRTLSHIMRRVTAFGGVREIYCQLGVSH